MNTEVPRYKREVDDLHLDGSLGSILGVGQLGGHVEAEARHERDYRVA